MTGLTCAKAPCRSCPYRRDVPSGVWAAVEYDKLPKYDGEIIDQALNGATGTFLCHQRDGHLCAGWLGTHGAENLLACRLQAGRIDPAIWEYRTDVPLFASGQEACDHGKQRIAKPDANAQRMTRVLARKKERYDRGKTTGSPTPRAVR